ncbi:hypothetical protein NEPAR03_2206 [Nematocida parisii]|nr:hypothetical protein NEPAR03_2206 [Nematocida parisii]
MENRVIDMDTFPVETNSLTEGSQSHQSDLVGTGTLKERVSCCFLGMILYFMDALTIGLVGLGVVPGVDISKYSTVFFVFGIFISQVIFFLFSSFQVGVITTPISETFGIIAEVSGILHKSYGLKDAELFWTILAFISISTLLSGFAFIVLYLTGFQKVLNKIPSKIEVALLFVIGCLCCKLGTSNMLKFVANYGDFVLYSTIAVYGIITFAFWYLSHAMSRRFPSLAPFSHCIILLVIISLSYISIFFWWGGIENARISTFLPQNGKNTSMLFDLPLLYQMEYNKIAWKSLCSINILTQMGIMVIVVLLQFPVNTPAISAKCKITPSLKKELVANGIANVLGSVLGFFPTYVVSSSTIALNRGKPTTKKIDGFVLVVCFILMYLVGQSVFAFIPQMCLDMLLLFIGFDILKDSIVTIKKEGLHSLLFTVCVAIPCVYYGNMPIGLGVGCGIFFLEYIWKLLKKSVLFSSNR